MSVSLMLRMSDYPNSSSIDYSVILYSVILLSIYWSRASKRGFKSNDLICLIIKTIESVIQSTVLLKNLDTINILN